MPAHTRCRQLLPRCRSLGKKQGKEERRTLLDQVSGADGTNDGGRSDTGLDEKRGRSSEALLLNGGELASVSQNLLEGSLLEVVLEVFVAAKDKHQSRGGQKMQRRRTYRRIRRSKTPTAFFNSLMSTVFESPPMLAMLKTQRPTSPSSMLPPGARTAPTSRIWKSCSSYLRKSSWEPRESSLAEMES